MAFLITYARSKEVLVKIIIKLNLAVDYEYVVSISFVLNISIKMQKNKCVFIWIENFVFGPFPV